MSHTELWASFRRQMPIVERWTYFDHAAVGPLPAPAADAVRQWCLEACEEGDTVWPRWNRGVERCRGLAAELLNARSAEIALVPSTTAGIGIVAEGIPWVAGDNVVTLDNEFPSNLYPWLNLASRGVETRRVATQRGRVDPNRLAEACDARTRLIAVSWVGYASGWRLDVAELAQMAHDRGALLMLDAIQGLGVFPLDVADTGVDFLAADGHKWMLGPEGAGIFYCRHDHLELLRPTGVGWRSAVNAFDYTQREFVPRAEASRYEGGTHNVAGFLTLAASLSLLQQVGLASDQWQLAERVLRLAEFAVEQLQQRGARMVFDRVSQHATGIVTFDWPGIAPEAVRRNWLDAGVVSSCRGGGVRIALHGYNTEEEIARAVELLPGRASTTSD